MLDGLDGVMSLAAASGEELGAVSDIVTDSLSAFQMEAKDSARFADVLAAASANANTDVSGLGAAFQYVAPVAGALGFTVEDTATAIGLMSNAGIKGEKAGTALRTMMTNLAKPTKAMKGEMDNLGISLTNTDGSMKTFDEIMNELRVSFGGLDEAQQAAAAATIFGKEAMSGSLAIINTSKEDYDKLSGAIMGSEGSAEKMAETMEGTLGGTLRTIKSGLEGFAISIYEEMLPSLAKGAEKIQGFVGWLNDLSPAAKKTALVIGGVAAAIGPLLVVGGTLLMGLGSIFTFVGSVSGAIAIMGTGVAASTPLIGGLATAFTVLTGPVGIAIAAIAGITAVGIGLYNHLKKDAIPEIDVFGEKVEGISDSTAVALDAFWELGEGVDSALMDMKVSGDKLTQEHADVIVGNFEKMNSKIVEKMNTGYEEQKSAMLESFEGTRYMTDEEQKKILNQMDTHHAIESEKQKNQMDRIYEIEKAALEGNRELTETELVEINAIKTSMQDTAIDYLSESAAEEVAIRQRLKDTAGDISLNQAAELIGRAAKVRDETIAAAETEYDDKLAIYTNMKDNLGTLSQKQYDTLVKKAKDQRDATVGESEGMYDDIYKDAVASNTELNGLIDKDTGQKLSKWDVYKAGVLERFKSTNEKSLGDFKKWGKDFDEGWTSFNTKAKEKFDEYKAGVVSRFKSTNEKSLGDFKKWGTDFNTGWTNFNTKAKEKVDEYKAGVVSRFKSTNADSLADFKRWGGNLKEWATDAKNKVLETFTNMVDGAKKLPGRIGEGIKSMAYKVADGVKSVSNKLASGLGTGVNGVIGGINWVLGKIGVSSKVPRWEVPQYAQGTKGHPGGLAILGDGRGSNAGRELIQTPSGDLSLSPAKDTLMNLPKGSQVLSAKKTKELLGSVPKYANGIGDFLGDIWDYVKNPSKLLNVALKTLGIGAPAGGSFVGDMAKGGYNKVKDGAIDFIKNKLSIFEESAGGNGQGFGPAFRLTSKRGWRFDPFTGIRTFHQGDDWGARSGTPIASQAAGKVVTSGFERYRGNTVRVKSGIYEHLYQHNSRNLVSAGQSVKKGQPVGLVGSTGDSTGPHLHHELKKNGVNINPQGLATGGMTTGFMASTLHEEGYPEIVIPTAPKRRTDAMKLLALAAKKIQGGGENVVRPNQLPNVQGADGGIMQKLLAATLQQNQLLMQLLNKDSDVYLDKYALVGAIGSEMDHYNGNSVSVNKTMKGL